MKKIIQPASPEHAVFYSDVNGTVFDNTGPDIQIKIDFNYGSKYDGSTLTFDLTDEEFEPILAFIKANVSAEYKKNLKKYLHNKENDYDANVQFRDWQACEYDSNCISLYKKIV